MVLFVPALEVDRVGVATGDDHAHHLRVVRRGQIEVGDRDVDVGQAQNPTRGTRDCPATARLEMRLRDGSVVDPRRAGRCALGDVDVQAAGQHRLNVADRGHVLKHRSVVPHAGKCVPLCGTAERNLGHMSESSLPGRPEEMRERLTDYVYALNKAYLTHIELLAPAERASMPLASHTRITVAVAAARDLHIVATPDALPAPRGPEVENTDEYAGVSWSVRFFDASILPELGMVGASGDDPVAVRRVLGVADVVYHLSVSVGGGLDAHHAQHAGVALANQHAAAIRDGQTIRHAYPGREHLVDEFVITERLGLTNSARLLASAIAGSGLTTEELAGEPSDLRRALLRSRDDD